MSRNDFGSADNSNYLLSLNEYTNSLSTATNTATKLQNAAQKKVQEFNEALDTPLETVGGALAVKSTEGVLEAVKPVVNKAIGKVTQTVGKQASELADNLGTKLQSAKDFLKSKLESTTEELAENPVTDSDFPLPDTGTSTQQMILDQDPEEGLQDIAQGQARVLSEVQNPVFDSDLERTAGEEGTNTAASAESDEVANQAVNQAVTQGGETAVEEGATEGALATTEEAAAGAAVGEGGANPIADIVALGLGLGMLFGGIFGKKHASTPPPPAVLSPTFQAGI